MIYIESDKLVAFDCDDTLVMWAEDNSRPEEGKILVDDVYLTPHQKHIKKLKGYKSAGWTVIVWSMGGHQWAKTVTETLELTEYVDVVMSKPPVLWDDMPLQKAFGYRKYLQDRKS